MFSAGGAGVSILQDLVNQQNPDMSPTSAEELSRYKEEKPIDEEYIKTWLTKAVLVQAAAEAQTRDARKLED